MSYPYRVRIAASVSETVRGRQESRRTVSLQLPSVPAEKLREQLLEELRRRGFREDAAGGALERRRGDVVERVDPRSLVATAAIEEERHVEEEAHEVVSLGRQNTKARVRQEVKRLEHELRERAQGTLDRELSARVDAAGRELERELNEAIADVYVGALQERARELGEVESVKQERVGSEVMLEIRISVAD